MSQLVAYKIEFLKRNGQPYKRRLFADSTCWTMADAKRHLVGLKGIGCHPCRIVRLEEKP